MSSVVLLARLKTDRAPTRRLATIPARQSREIESVGVRPIVVKGFPVLHRKAKRVSQFDKNLRTLVDDMIETMRAAPGVGLAAPQIGVPLRLAVTEVDEKVT